jgi:hypothetical protein
MLWNCSKFLYIIFFNITAFRLVFMSYLALKFKLDIVPVAKMSLVSLAEIGHYQGLY